MVIGMADNIETNTGMMERDVDSLKEALNRVRQDMKGMFDAVMELNGMWSGQANEAFNRQFQLDSELFASLCEEAEGIIESMDNAKDAYNRCEAEVSQEIGRIRL
ncbi:MAG: WXG100 family type VII secretion target [Blautia sp.]|nr:WXG100 family type VII secretion target [Blautia sp.]